MKPTENAHQPETAQLVVAERRAWVRYPCDLEAFCQLIAEEAEVLWPSRIQNISAGGMALLATRPFQLGALLEVEIQLSSKRFSRPTLVRVVNVTPHSQGGWFVSCKFPCPLAEHELRALLG
jgi:hypothetical protein